MKKIILLLLLSLMFIPTTIYAETVDTKEKIYDYANLLTGDEESNLKSSIKSAIEKTNLDIVAVIIDDNDYSSAMDYAEHFYYNNDFGFNASKDGIILLIDMDNRELWIATSGEGQLLFDDARIEEMLDNMTSYISADDFKSGINSFIEDVENYHELGNPKSNKDYYIDDDGNMVRKKSVNWVITAIGSVIISGITIWILIAKHKMIVAAKYANQYIDDKNTKLYTPIDTFLTTYTSTVKINRDSGGSGRSGGSSTHRGAGGRSFGGGGRKF